MGFKKLGFDNNPLYDFEGKKEGAAIEGHYCGSRNIESIGSIIHTIKKADGSLVDFWGSGLLNYLLEKVEKNKLIRVTYRGVKNIPVEFKNAKGKLTKTKKDVHQYDVEVDEG